MALFVADQPYINEQLLPCEPDYHVFIAGRCRHCRYHEGEIDETPHTHPRSQGSYQ